MPIANELKKNGYTINSTFFCREGSEFYKKKLNVFRTDNEYKSGNGTVWNSFKHIMEKKFNFNGPNFLYIHFAPTNDQNNMVENTLKYLKEKNLYENSFIIISSDHGYTDFGSYKPIGWLMKPRNHSIYSTEDCYRANLALKLPFENKNSSKININAQVGLFDIFETIFDYLNFKYGRENKRAISFKKLLENPTDLNINSKFNERLIRIDNRFIGQDYKITVIRNNNYELIINNQKYTLYKRDNSELNWKKSLKPHFDEYNFLALKNFYEETQIFAKTNIQSLLIEKVDYSDLFKLNNKKIIMYNYGNSFLLNFCFDILSKTNFVKIMDYKLIKKNIDNFDLVLAIKSNDLNYSLDKIYHINKSKFKLFDVNFNFVNYKKHSIIDKSKSDWRAYVGKNIYEKMVVFLILSWLQILDYYLLWKTKENYLKTN